MMFKTMKKLGHAIAATAMALTFASSALADDMDLPFENIGWIVEAQIKEGKRAEFEAVMHEIIAATHANEPGTLNYQYYASESGLVLVYERFSNVDAAEKHIASWNTFAARWIETADVTQMWHIGNLPDDLRANHAVLNPHNMRPLGGFTR
jgi:quinol monooxygenase YgiN